MQQSSQLIKTDRVLNSKHISLKTDSKIEQAVNGVVDIKKTLSSQYFSPQAAAQPPKNQRRSSGLMDLQNGSGLTNSKFYSDNSKLGSSTNTFRQFDMTDIKQNPANYALRNFQPTLKPIPNINSSPQKKGYPNKNNSKEDTLLQSGYEFSDNAMHQSAQNTQKSLSNNNLLKRVTSSPGGRQEGSGFGKLLTDSNQVTNRINSSLLGSPETDSQYTRLHTASGQLQSSQKNYFYSPTKLGKKPMTSQGGKGNYSNGLGTRSVSNINLIKSKINPNSINSLNNINDFEDTQIFQDFQKPLQLPTQSQQNDSVFNNNIQQTTESSHHTFSTLQNIPQVRKESTTKPFKVKTKSASQLQTLSGFQKLQKVRKALALGSKVAKFLEVLKQVPQEKYNKASEQYAKECIQILKGILQEKEQEAEQFENMELNDEQRDIEGIDVKSGIAKNTQKLTNKVMRTIQDNIVEPLSQQTYRALYYQKCKEIDKVKFNYKDMEQELEKLRKNQKVFDDIAANYFRKTESIEKEKDQLLIEKKTALLEIERLEKKLEESNNYYNFWQGEYHQVHRKYNEEVYAINQYEEKMKKERTEKVFLENQLSSLQKQIEGKNGELEKIKTAQVQLKWMKGSISNYQQDLLNKNIQINLCKDLVVSKADALQILPKEQLDKDQPLQDLVKQVFQAIAIKLS